MVVIFSKSVISCESIERKNQKLINIWQMPNKKFAEATNQQ